MKTLLTKANVEIKDLPRFCIDFLKFCGNKTIVLLQGPLAAGKTTFVKKCCESLHCTDVNSPTFSVINEYQGDRLIYHVDLYRLQDSKDIESTGFWDLFEQPHGLIFIEWPQRLPQNQIPLQWEQLQVVITPLNETSRQFEVFKLGVS